MIRIIDKLWFLTTIVMMMMMIVLAANDEHHHPKIIATSTVSIRSLERRKNNNNKIIYKDHDDDEYEDTNNGAGVYQYEQKQTKQSKQKQQKLLDHSDERNGHELDGESPSSSWLYSIFHQITTRYIFTYFSSKTFNIDDDKKEESVVEIDDDSITRGNQIMSQSRRSRKTIAEEEEEVKQPNSNNNTATTIICPMMSCENDDGMELIPNNILSFDLNSVVSCEAVTKASNDGYFTIEDCNYIYNLMIEQNTCQCRRIVESSKFSKQSFKTLAPIIKSKITTTSDDDNYFDDDGLSIAIQNDDDDIEPTKRDFYNSTDDFDDDDDDSLIVGIQSDDDGKPTAISDKDASNNDNDDDGLLVDIQSDDDGVLVAVTLPPSSKPSSNDEEIVRVTDVPASSPSLSSRITNQGSDDDTSFNDPTKNPTEAFHPPYPLCVLCVSSIKKKGNIKNTRKETSTTTKGSSNEGATFMTTSSITIKNTALVDMTEIPCDDAIDAGYLGLLTPSNCQYLKKVILEQNACACQLSSSETNQQQKKPSPSLSPIIIDTTNRIPLDDSIVRSNNVNLLSRSYYNIQRSKYTSNIVSSNELLQNPIANFTV